MRRSTLWALISAFWLADTLAKLHRRHFASAAVTATAFVIFALVGWLFRRAEKPANWGLQALRTLSVQNARVDRHARNRIDPDCVEGVDFRSFADAASDDELVPCRPAQVLRHFQRKPLHRPLLVDVRIEERRAVGLKRRHGLLRGQVDALLPALDGDPALLGVHAGDYMGRPD